MSIGKTLLLILVASLLAGCYLFDGIKGSGNIVSQKLEFKDFNQVEAGSQFQIKITRADQYKVIVYLDDNLQKYLKTSQTKDRLIFDMKGHHHFRISDKSMRVEITTPTLSAIELTGAAEGQIQGFDSKQPLKIKLSGAAQLKGDIKASHCNFSLSGASSLRLSGSATSLVLQASGASDANIKEFTVLGQARINLSGAADADINCQGELSYQGSGAANLTYRGKAKLLGVNTSGAASIQHR